MAKKIGVVLSGCGVYDGAEIHESVVTLLAIDRNGAEAVMAMSPRRSPRVGLRDKHPDSGLRRNDAA